MQSFFVKKSPSIFLFLCAVILVSIIVTPIINIYPQVAHAEEEGGSGSTDTDTDTDTGSVGDINDGGSNIPDASRNWINVSHQCNQNGTSNVDISWFVSKYPPHNIISYGIYKNGVLIHNSRGYQATNPNDVTGLPVYVDHMYYNNFASDASYTLRIGVLSANVVGDEGGQNIAGWTYGEFISQTFGPFNCAAADLVGFQTAIYGYAVNDSRTVTPGPLQFNSSVGNVGDANTGAFNVQVEVTDAADATSYSAFSSKFRSSGLTAGQTTWFAPINFDGSALIPGGNYLARICVDVDGEVPERNGSNNCGEWNSFSVGLSSGTWTTYCTGSNDPNGNNWQWWQYSDTSPRQYKFLRPGDGTCVPSDVTWVPYCTGSNDPNGNNWQWWEYNNASPVEYRFVRAGDGTCTAATASPDLTVSGITPTSAVAGTPTTFSATVYNTGTGSTGISFKNFYQVKIGSVSYTPHNFFAKLLNIAHAAETITDLTYTTMAALPSGGSGNAIQTYTFPASGTYGIRVCADKADRNDAVGVIPEANEDNNCGGWTDVNVTATCTPGASCSVSNACNYATGTYDSSCTCSATVPPVPSNFGQACSSVPATNACGMVGTGTILCNGTCSATTPSDTLCLPTVTLSADPTRVRKDTSTKLTWTSTAATSCSLTGQNGFSSSALSGTAVDSTPLDAQTTFTLTCSNTYGSKSASVIVNLLPTYIER